MEIELTVNSTRRNFEIRAGETLLNLLRREGYKGVKKGCEQGDCGSCIVLVDGRAVNSCLFLAAKANGSDVLTIEGLADKDELHPIQQAFLDEGAVQCGYCTPGMIMSAVDLLHRNPDPSEQEIRHAISGNLCRCTGYEQQIQAIKKAATRMKETSNA